MQSGLVQDHMLGLNDGIKHCKAGTLSQGMASTCVACLDLTRCLKSLWCYGNHGSSLQGHHRITYGHVL